FRVGLLPPTLRVTLIGRARALIRRGRLPPQVRRRPRGRPCRRTFATTSAKNGHPADQYRRVREQPVPRPRGGLTRIGHGSDPPASHPYRRMGTETFPGGLPMTTTAEMPTPVLTEGEIDQFWTQGYLLVR